jgi:ABC-type uncharacterized transport system auxiliary subunit
MKRALAWLAPWLLVGCVSVGIGGEAALHTHHVLRDDAPVPVPRLSQPLVGALLIQALPADALVDTASIAYSRRTHEFAFYQLASWADRPTRELPRLLQRRLEARGVAAAVGTLGGPLRADWLLSLRIDTLHHDVSAVPGTARFALSVELFDRRSHVSLARRRFEASAATPTPDSAAAAAALSRCVTQVFDALLPWLEGELQSGVRPR